MPVAALLLREATPPSLSSLVEQSQHRPPPHPIFELHLSSTHFSFKPPETPDEGFESDIDSIVSNSSYEAKTAETDSANGSANSDSETETPEPLPTTFNLVDCLCYTDVTFPHILVFVLKKEVLVFRFDDVATLEGFYLNFSALKAVANHNKGKFNLLQRTDDNGVTHIEVELVKKMEWGSMDRLDQSPRRPERRKKKAPPPPVQAPPTSDVLRGEYVRVNVNTDTKDFIAKSQLVEKKVPKSNLVTLLIPKPVRAEPSWTNSVPRLVKKQRSKSETRHFTPMAYRYIDTTPTFYPMRERLFGLSAKLKDFRDEGVETKQENLKSVIKKEEGRKKKEKKVTFSAYATVQVL